MNTWEITSVPLQGSLYVEGNIGGSAEQPQVELKLDLFNGAIADTQLASANFRAGLNSARQLRVDAEVRPSVGTGHFE